MTNKTPKRDLNRKEQEEVRKIFEKYCEPYEYHKKHSSYYPHKLNYFNRMCFIHVLDLIRTSRRFCDKTFNSNVKKLFFLMNKNFLMQPRKRSIFDKNDIWQLEDLKLYIDEEIKSIRKSEATKMRIKRKKQKTLKHKQFDMYNKPAKGPFWKKSNTKLKGGKKKNGNDIR